MIVNSFEFFIFFPLIFLIYLIIASIKIKSVDRLGNWFLLLVSYILFWNYNEWLTIVLFGVTLITWLGSIWIHRYKITAIATVIISLAALPLLTFKYYNFIGDNIKSIFSILGLEYGLPGLNIAIPLGISFFTLQAIGYFIDVAKGKIEREKNFADYMLFVSFFPQIASGPISKAQDLLPQIKAKRSFDRNMAVSGLKWLLWGMFMKVVVADNIGELITNPLMKSGLYTSATVWQAALLYSIQIYCDFAGYSFMALGIGELMGFKLVNNFERPYFASTVTEFWHRWHRSLSIWLKDYIYIPLGGSRKGKYRTYFNILITFLVSGLWHGANWTFILWGSMHGGVQIIEKHLGIQKSPDNKMIKAIRIGITFFIVTLAWIFFVNPDISGAYNTIKCMFAGISGKSSVDFTYIYIPVAIVLIKDLADEFQLRHIRVLHHQSAIVRWTSYSLLMASIMIFAVYGEKFIYSGF